MVQLGDMGKRDSVLIIAASAKGELDACDRFAIELVCELFDSGYMPLKPVDEVLAHASYIIAPMLRAYTQGGRDA